jgi:nucleotide-binding universal stress UspA family protein
MKNIVVPIDFSTDSFNGLNFGIIIANTIKANITLVYVQKHDNELYKNNTKKIMEDAKSKMTAIQERFKGAMTCGKIDFKIRQGKVHEEVVNQAKYNDSCLIICSTHGISGFEELFIGSNAYKIVSSASCPVITVRKGAYHTNINKIILPIDASRQTRQKVPFTMELAQQFDAELHLLKVFTSSYEEAMATVKNYAKQVEEYLKKHKMTNYVVADREGDNLTDVTLQYAAEIDADLISIMTEQEKSLRNIIIGPYAQQMVNHSPIPVLSIHNKELYRSFLSTSAKGNPFI